MKIRYKREKAFAALLKKQKRKYTYQAPCFRLKKGYYRPDFYLPEENLYIEFVGTRQAYSSNKAKYAEFQALYPLVKFQIVWLKDIFKGNEQKDREKIYVEHLQKINNLILQGVEKAEAYQRVINGSILNAEERMRLLGYR